MIPLEISLILFSLCFLNGKTETNVNNHYCAEMQQQHQVDIQQIMGMWYGIEIISHDADAKHGVVFEEGCPILYFSEDNSPTTTTYSPLHRNYNYQSNYGSGYGRGYQDMQNRDQQDDIYDDYNKLRPAYSDPYYYTTDTPYYKPSYNNYYKGHKNKYFNRRWQHEPLRRLRILWEDKGHQVDYTVRYNVSKAGLWFSSGPHNGSSLHEKFDHFAGVIQVLKAVGNHMVLVFCHRLPDQKLFTILLSRVQNLKHHDISGVHNLLNRKGLSTGSVKKVCTGDNGSVTLRGSLLLLLPLIVVFNL